MPHFSTLLRQQLKDTRISVAELGRLTEIPEQTLRNWLQDTSRRPQDWRRVVAIAAVLNATLADTNALLQSAYHPSLYTLHRKHGDVEVQLFRPWHAVLEQPAESPAGSTSRSAHPLYIRPHQHFFGRAQELHQLLAWLHEPEVHVIVISGISGIGKSSLAIAAGYAAADAFADGLVEISVRTLSNATPETIATEVLHQCAPELLYTQPDRSLALRYFLRRNKFLLLLNDLPGPNISAEESLLAYLAQILPSDGRSKVIVTTQTAISNLEASLFTRTLPLDRGLDEEAALALTRTLSLSLGVSFEPYWAELVINKLAGHPKLLELAVSKIQRMGWQQTYDSVKAIRGSIESAWAEIVNAVQPFLSDIARQVLQLATLIPTASFHASELKVLLDVPTDLNPALEQLIDAHLVSFAHCEDIYSVHQLVADYVSLHHHWQPVDRTMAFAHLAQYYVTKLELNGAAKEGWILENALGVLAQGDAHVDNGLYLRLAISLAPELDRRRLYGRGANLLVPLYRSYQAQMHLPQAAWSNALAYYVGLFAYQERHLRIAAEAFDHYLRLTEGQTGTFRAHAYHLLAILHSWPRGNRYLPVDTLQLYKMAFRLWQKQGDQLRCAYVLSDLGYETFHLKNIKAAQRWIDRALTLAEAHPKPNSADQVTWGIILRTTGHYYRDTCQYDLARRYYAQSVAVLEQTGDIIELADTFATYGRLLADRKDCDVALQVLEQDISLCEQFALPRQLADALGSLGKTYTIMQRYGEAGDAYGASIAVGDELDAEEKIFVEYVAHYGLGRVAAAQQNYREAATRFEQSLQLRKVNGHVEGMPAVLLALGDAYWALGQHDTLAAVVQELEAMLRQRKHPLPLDIQQRVREEITSWASLSTSRKCACWRA